ncbi:MAG: 2-oxo-4-hydroxy-4-carboxy-5-ureidoimidazoline decarboxylase [Chloroflexota bacterium]
MSTEWREATPEPSAADLSIDRLDVIAPGAFAAAVAPLFEGARGFIGRLAMARPFGTVDGLFASAREIVRAMPRDEQIELIDAHPRLGAPPASVSTLSYVEQGYGRAGSADETAAADAAEAQRAHVATELERLNTAYEARFGFRYCVFVAGRSRAELLPELAAALELDRDTEIERALEAVVDIAHDRYATLTVAAAEDHA